MGVDTSRQNPIWRIVLSRSGQSTQTYTNTRILEIDQSEEEFSQTAVVLLDNSDNALTTIDFEMYKGVISFGYNDSTQGDEYSPIAPLYVVGQRLFSAQGVLVCQLELIGIPNLMAQDKAESELPLTEGDARTVKTLLTAVVDKTLTPYTNYTSFTATYDSEDTLIDSFKPKEAFRVSMNESRLSKVEWLLARTGSKMRAEDDGKAHFFDPVISGATYDYEYKLNVSGDHTFFSKELRNRFVNPNKEVVESHPSHQPQYSSSATSATSNALFPKTHTTRLRLTSTTEASNIATAIIERYELDAELGAVTVPMNVGQEVWDWIKVTDSRQNDSRTGNVRFLRRHVKIPERGGRLIWDMDIRFGKAAVLPLNILPSVPGQAQRTASVSLEALTNAHFALADDVQSVIDKLNEVIEFINTETDVGYFRKLTITDELNIPSE